MCHWLPQDDLMRIFVADGAYALHSLRRLRRLGRLILGIGEAGELDHAAVGLDVERTSGARADIGSDRRLHLRAQGGVGAGLGQMAARRLAAHAASVAASAAIRSRRIGSEVLFPLVHLRSASSFWRP